MNSTLSNSPRYTTSDIQKYLKGELSAREMHELERAALEDPFLADALDGYTVHETLQTNSTVEEDLAELRQRLAEKNRDSKSVPLLETHKQPIRRLDYRVAAAVILVIGIGLTTWV